MKSIILVFLFSLTFSLNAWCNNNDSLNIVQSKQNMTNKTLNSRDNALDFDGINDYVNLNIVSSAMANSNNFTIEFWMRADLNNQANTSYPSTAMFAINLPYSTPTGSNRLLFMLGDVYSTQNGKLWVGNNLATPFLSSTVIGDNSCHHIAYTHSGSTGTIYIDGVYEGVFTDSIVLSSNDLYSLGQEWDGSSTSQYYNGQLDEIRIWNITRTQADIISTMNAQLAGNESGLMAYYNCNQGAPGGQNTGVTSIIDNTNSGLNGTLNYFTLNGATSNWVIDTCTNTTTAINPPLNTATEVSIYPNPATNLLTVTSSKHIDEIRIIDLTGKTVKTITNNFDNIEISYLSKGLYSILLIYDNRIIMRKLIKN